MVSFFFAVLPIVALIVVMTKPRPWPSTVAFAFAAALTFGIRVWYFEMPVPLGGAAVVAGLLNALTPIAIVFGAIFFFVAMEKSGAMDVLRQWLTGLSGHPVAQLMIVGWAFQFLIEGASGFGTPAALAAPVLVALGFPAMRVAALCLVMNSVSVSFGAVGTPTWFGFGGLNLSEPELRALGWMTGLLQGAASLVIPVLALSFVVSWRQIRSALGFIYASIAACVLPMILVSRWNDEFPSVVGGLLGLVITILLARSGIGLSGTSEIAGKQRPPLFPRKVFRSLLPLLATVVILLVTRIPAFGFRQWLTTAVPNLAVPLGWIGELTISPALVLQVENILGQGLNWSFALLYVPSIIPFVLTAGLAIFLFRARKEIPAICRETLGRIQRPVFALFGALVFVQLLMVGGENSSTLILGGGLADVSGDGWPYFAPLLGALGSFFSGSATISNLTFGGIQASIAGQIGQPVPALLALQSVGAAMGNMICIHNIVAVCAVLGLVNREGEILKSTIGPALASMGVFALVVWLFGLWSAFAN